MLAFLVIQSSTICRLVATLVLLSFLMNLVRCVNAPGVVTGRVTVFQCSPCPTTCRLVATPVLLGLWATLIHSRMFPDVVVGSVFLIPSSFPPRMYPDVVVGSVILIPSSLPRICPDVLIGGVFLLLHPHPVIPIVLILYHSINHPIHHIHPMLTDAACRFFPPAPRALLFR